MKAEHRLMRGPAPAAVLKLLEREPLSGYAILCELRHHCPDALAQGDASAVALLHFLEAQNFVTGNWQSASAPRRRVYQLTDHGRGRLAEELRSWQSLAELFRTSSAHASSGPTNEESGV